MVGVLKTLVHILLGALYGVVLLGVLFLVAAVSSSQNDLERADDIILMLGMGPVLLVVLIGTILLHWLSERWFKGH